NFLFANLAVRTGQTETAEGLYRTLYNRGSLPPGVENVVYSGLIRVLLLRHKYDEAIDVCKQGLEKAEATNRTFFHLQMSRAYLLMGKETEAQAAADEAANIADDKNRLSCRLNRAGILAQCGNK